MACRTPVYRAPLAQPSSGPPVPTSAFAYNMLDLPTTKADTSGATTRTKVVGYDTAGRITVSVISGPGATVPWVGVTYDAATGSAEEQRGHDRRHAAKPRSRL